MRQLRIRTLAGDVIWALTRTKSPFRIAMKSLAQRYINAMEDRSYDVQRNGEECILQLLSALQPRCVFDVGANVGEWTELVLRTNPEAHVHAFELSPRTALTLSRRFQTEQRVTVNQFGLADKSGTVTFREYPENPRLNTLVDGGVAIHPMASVGVSGAVHTGDQYCAERNIEHIDFLKIDVEGAEHLVLAGFTDLLSQHRIRLVQFEYGFINAATHYLLSDFREMFSQIGYIVAPLRSYGVGSTEYRIEWNNFDSGPNFVALQADDTELLSALKS